MNQLTLRFSGCFDRDKLRRVLPLLERTYAALNELAPWRKGRWPTTVRCMSERRIIEGRARGAGHGYTYQRGRSIWINPRMTAQGYWLVLVHENLHHAFPDATEAELNCTLLPHVYRRVTGRWMSPAWARRHGVGSPVPGVGDRSFCR